jgi:hypothetical protein
MSSRKEELAAVLERLELWFLLLEETPGELQDQSHVSHGAQDARHMRAGMGGNLSRGVNYANGVGRIVCALARE